MEEENKKCFRCKHFDRYYIKQVKQFQATKFGLCFNCGNTVNSNDGCDKFEYRKPRKIQESVLRYYLSDLLTEISELRKTVEAEMSENEKL